MFRSTPVLLSAALSSALLLSSVAFAAQPNFSGTWQLDTAHSQMTDARGITLTIVQNDTKIQFDAVVREPGGAEKQFRFSCATSGASCDYDEAGHKAKVAAWYNGVELVACKTEGSAGDIVNEWHMKLSPDGKTLSVDLEHVDPAGKAEALVFTKK